MALLAAEEAVDEHVEDRDEGDAEEGACEHAADVVESIAEMQPQRVVYVSCDSATMARDVKRLADLGYTAQRACAVDMFPRADHVEAVCLLTTE